MRLAVPAVALKMLSSRFGHDMSGFDLDGPVPNLPLSNAIQSHAKVAYEKARKANLTLRDIYNQVAVARGYLFACGDAAMVARCSRGAKVGGPKSRGVMAVAHR